MPRRTRKQYWWHVAGGGGWYQLSPGGFGITNVGRDIVLVLVDSEEPTGDEPVVPENDNFVIERVIGQWQLTGNEAVGLNYFIHERVYVTEVGPGSVSLRDLSSAREADTSFLYHNITSWDASYNGDTWGNWNSSGLVTDQPAQYRTGGPYFRDIKVGRRVNEGEALIYHLQIEGAGIPVDATFGGQFWMRTLLRKAGD